MTNFLQNHENSKKIPLRATAVGLIAASALSMAGCARSFGGSEGYATCVGSQAYKVESGDTLGEVLLDKTVGVESGTVRDIAIAVAEKPEFLGKGDLPTVNVTHYVEGTKEPTLTAGETVDIPLQCSN